MNFNSASFLIFLPTVVLIYLLVRSRERPRDLFLLMASYYFYMSWNWKYAGLIAFSTIVDYFVGLRLDREERPGVRRLLLVVSLTANLGLLGIFKYYNFFMDVTDRTLSLIGFEFSAHHLNVLLPVGISFYTFQTMSYTIDLYRRKIPHEGDFIKFALFVSFFPQLVAGPIVRASEFLPQLHRVPMITRPAFNSGMTLVFQGLFKKIVLADLLAALAVDDVFANPAAFSSWDLYMALVGYAFQVYNDFSGYSDIAIGAARMLGFELPVNFNRPYVARDIRELWTRWHISLSTWLRDYLYFPLGGSRRGEVRTYFNLLVTFLLGGLWHGAAANYVLWGLYSGVLLMGSHAMKDRRPLLKSPWLQKVRCFHSWLIGLLIFRCASPALFKSYVVNLADFSGATVLSPLFYGILALAIVLHAPPRRWASWVRERVATAPDFMQGAVYASLLLLYLSTSLGTPAFIYFQF